MIELFPEEIILDRSTAQSWATCPQMAWHLSRRAFSGGRDAEVGNETHRIIAEACKLRQEQGAQPREVREYIEAEAVKSRPDVQPAVIAALRRGGWLITQILCFRADGHERHPDDLICYDGGQGEYSGQVSGDIMVGSTSVRLTTELDLMIATASPNEVEIVDYKSGWKWYTASEVLTAFQFQFQAWCVFFKYPTLERITTRVVMTREGQATSPVYFEKSDMFAIGNRLRNAAELFLNYKDAERAEDVPWWPMPDKCSICDVACHCKAGTKPEESEVALDPQAYLGDYVALDARAAKMKAALTQYVRQKGSDLETGSLAFGVNKPKSARAQAMDYYDIPTPELMGLPAVRGKKPKKQPDDAVVGATQPAIVATNVPPVQAAGSVISDEEKRAILAKEAGEAERSRK